MSTTLDRSSDSVADVVLTYLLLPVAALAAAASSLVWLAGQLAAVFTGHGWPDVAWTTGWRMLRSPVDPIAAWPRVVRADAGPVWLLWAIAIMEVLTLAAVAAVVIALVLRRRTTPGLASSRELQEHMGASAACTRARTVRPSLRSTRRLDPRSAAMFVATEGPARGKGLFAQHEDSMYVVGPPRSGKTVRLAAGLVIDAPGAVVATSTKADLPTWTLGAREQRGLVAVFDPEEVWGWPQATYWSPVTGCEDPDTALDRARAFVAARPITGDSRYGGFFGEAADTVLACFLHAAALDGRPMRDVVRWAGDFSDPTPGDILRHSTDAPEWWWPKLKEFTTGAADETTSSTKMTLDLVLKPLASPKVLRWCSPADGRGLDVRQLLAERGSLFLLSRGGSGSAAPLVTALADCVTRHARDESQRQADGRLDPPLRLVLDEAPNIAPLPDLPTLMSDSGGRGITTCVFTQSFAQARARWGRDAAWALFGSATLAMILGGLKEDDALESLSRIVGERTVRTRSQTHGHSGASHGWSERRERVLPVAKIRQLRADRGEALLLYRHLESVVRLQAVWERRDTAALESMREQTQTRARSAWASESLQRHA